MKPSRSAALILLVMGSVAACTAAGPIAVGDLAPPFTLIAADGSTFSLDDPLGASPILLYFNMAYG